MTATQLNFHALLKFHAEAVKRGFPNRGYEKKDLQYFVFYMFWIIIVIGLIAAKIAKVIFTALRQFTNSWVDHFDEVSY